MKLVFSFVIPLVLPIFTPAQQHDDLSLLRRLEGIETSASQIGPLAHALTDSCGPRLTNSPGFFRAVNWCVGQLNSWGISARTESWGPFGKGWENMKSYAAMTAPYYEPLIAYPVAWTSGTAGLVSGKVVMIPRLDSAAIESAANILPGSFVLVYTTRTILRSAEGEGSTRLTFGQLDSLGDNNMASSRDMLNYRGSIRQQTDAVAYLAQKGALGLLAKYYGARDGTVYVNGAAANHSDSPEPLLQLVVSTEDYLKMQRLLEGHATVRMEADIRNKWYTDHPESVNVIGEIAGSDPVLKNQVVMVGAHLDSWHSGTGATDNAAGCLVMMEALRLIKSADVHLRRTIRIGLWSGEEQGHLGSHAYVLEHFGDQATMKLTPEQSQLSVYLNLDNGTGKIRGVYLQHNEKAMAIFRQWLQPFAQLGAATLSYANTGSTDHLSFDAVGIPAFEFIQDPMEYDTRTHHTNMDVYDHLSFPDLQQAAIVVAGLIVEAANADEMVPRKPLPAPEPFLHAKY